MCGIAGYITNKKYLNFSFEKASKNLKLIMRNRGPDQQGSFCHTSNNYIVNLFSSRLSIIDLDPRSNQPFKSGDLIIIFNGEIYNYIELKKYLQNKKIQFKTNSDTEVLLKSYEYWGENCVDHFDGMWAFCIYDGKKNKVFISRDNFGEKPLYYYSDKNNLFFGSEIKFIHELSQKKDLEKINFLKINNYIYNGYKSLHKTNDTFFENICELEPGTNLTLDLNKFNLKKKKYLDRKEITTVNVSKNLEENVSEIKKLLFRSLELRLRSDVPIAFCLSGGIDSASLVSICYKYFNIKAKCFSIIDRDERYNERENIDIIKKDLKCDVEYIFLKKEKKENFLKNMEDLIKYHDSPISTISYYAHSKISAKAKNSGHKVILSGTGADEIFTGYYDHFLMHLNEIKNKKKFKKEIITWKKLIKPLVRNKNLQNPDLFYKNPDFREHIYYEKDKFYSYFKKKIVSNFFEKKYSKNLMKNRMLNELFHESVPVILKEDDLNSMYHSIENRSPFLSKNLVSYAMSIKNEDYITDSYSKNILRLAMKGTLNEKIRTDRQKKGFNTNLKSITNFDGESLYDFLIESKTLNNLINLKQIKKINFKNEISNSMNKFLFSLINLKIFFQINKQ
jgi:asparagine synthase (glutamine-hydrolysing)